MQKFTIDEVIAAHWGETVVLRGETPEAYAIRREAERLAQVWIQGWDRGSCSITVVRFGDGHYEWLRGD